MTWYKNISNCLNRKKDDQNSINYLEEFDVLSSVWIMANNDDDSLMFYESVKNRLGLHSKYQLKEIITKRSELFRRKISKHRLDLLKIKWHAECAKAHPKMPSFIFRLDTAQERTDLIDSITEDDIFRSQFRVKDDAPKADIEIIDWGIKHIERLRNNLIDKKEKRKRILKEIWIPFGSILLTMIILISNIYMQRKSQEIQIDLKKYEISFKPKQDYYATILSSMLKAFSNASNRNHESLVMELDNVEKTFYFIEPFLNENARKVFWTQIQNFESMCFSYEKLQSTPLQTNINRFADSLIKYRSYFREDLYPILFKNSFDMPK